MPPPPPRCRRTREGGGHQAARHYVAYLAGTPCGGTARGNASGAMASTSSPPFVLPTRSNPAMRKAVSWFCILRAYGNVGAVMRVLEEAKWTTH